MTWVSSIGTQAPAHDVVLERAVRNERPERKHEVAEPVIGLAGIGGTVGRVHAAPIGLRHVVGGGPVDQREAMKVGGVDVGGFEAADMQKAEMRRVDFALEALQPVALPLNHADRDFVLGQEHRFVGRRRRSLGARAHIGPDEPGVLERPVRLGLDLRAEFLVRRHVRHVQTIAVHVELPSVIDAAQPVAFRTSEEQRRAPVRAGVLEQPDAPAGVSKRDQFLAQKHEPHGRPAGGQLGGRERGDPIFAHHAAHRRVGPDAREQFVILRRYHGCCSCVRPRPSGPARLLTSG